MITQAASYGLRHTGEPTSPSYRCYQHCPLKAFCFCSRLQAAAVAHGESLAIPEVHNEVMLHSS